MPLTGRTETIKIRVYRLRVADTYERKVKCTACSASLQQWELCLEDLLSEGYGQTYTRARRGQQLVAGVAGNG